MRCRVIRRDRADKGDVDVIRRLCRQRLENRRLECQMIDFGANAGAPEEIHRRRQLRHHQIVDGPVLAAARRDADLADQDRLADALDPPHQRGVDMEGVLVEDEIGFELLDLREQDVLRPEHRASD